MIELWCENQLANQSISSSSNQTVIVPDISLLSGIKPGQIFTTKGDSLVSLKGFVVFTLLELQRIYYTKPSNTKGKNYDTEQNVASLHDTLIENDLRKGTEVHHSPAQLLEDDPEVSSSQQGNIKRFTHSDVKRQKVD